MLTVKTVVGTTLIIVGLILTLMAGVIGIIYGPISIIIGIMFIVFSKDESTIEKRKDINSKKTLKQT